MSAKRESRPRILSTAQGENEMTIKPMGTKEGGLNPETTTPRDDLRTAYQIHTLSQILYGHLAARQPWPASPVMGQGFEHMPVHPFSSIAPYWAGMWGAPMGP